MAEEIERRRKDNIARLLALLALVISIAALLYGMQIDKKAQDALNQARDGTTTIETVDQNDDKLEETPGVSPETNTGTDDAGGAGTGVNNTGAQ